MSDDDQRFNALDIGTGRLFRIPEIDRALRVHALPAPHRKQKRPPLTDDLLHFWAQQDLNLRPTDYESAALTN